MNIRGKFLLVSGKKWGKVNNYKYSRRLFLLSKVCPQEKLVNMLTCSDFVFFLNQPTGLREGKSLTPTGSRLPCGGRDTKDSSLFSHPLPHKGDRKPSEKHLWDSQFGCNNSLEDWDLIALLQTTSLCILSHHHCRAISNSSYKPVYICLSRKNYKLYQKAKEVWRDRISTRTRHGRDIRNIYVKKYLYDVIIVYTCHCRVVQTHAMDNANSESFCKLWTFDYNV